MIINKLISNYNFKVGTEKRIKYIVIHYVGALGDARANAKYYASGDKKASAHYFVGHAGDVWQSVEDRNIAWHCGSLSYVHKECRNANSIGIEMCVRKTNKSSLSASDKDWYFEQATVDSTIELVKELMVKYNIDADHVVRHYDVTGKICPNPYVYNLSNHTWTQFKAALVNNIATEDKPATTNYYRIRKTWSDVKSQLGAYTDLNNAIKACKEGYSVFDKEGNVLYKKDNTSYKAKIVAKSGLNIRTGTGSNFKKIGAIPYNTTITITKERNGWGYTTYKNMGGWVSLQYIKK